MRHSGDTSQMDVLQRAAERRKRQGETRRRNWYRSMMDCGDVGCGECRVCRHYDFVDYVQAVAPRDVPYSVSYDPCVTAYLKRKQ